MRQLRLTLWHIGLVTLLVVSVMVALLAGLRVLAPQWRADWLLPLLALVAAEAVITQRLVARQRLALLEQGNVRAVEWLLIVVAVRLTSLAAEEQPLLATITPWLRDPLAFFGGRFAGYLLPTIVAWLLATGLAQLVIGLGDESVRRPPRRPGEHPNESIELAEELEERAAALARFDRAWLLCLLLALASAALVIGGQPLWSALQDRQTLLPVAAVLIILIVGLSLHSFGQFEQLSTAWNAQQVQVDADVPRRWRRASSLLTTGAVMIGLALGGLVVLIPPPPIAPLINLLLMAMAYALAALIALISLLMLPFMLLLAWLMGEPPPVPPRIEPIQPPQLPTGPIERPLLPSLIFWACVMMLVGIALLRYVQQREDLRALVGRWPGMRRLLRWLDALWGELRAWSDHAVATLRERLRPRRRVAPRLRRLPRGPYAQLRALYQRLKHAAADHGVPTPPSQTPYELRSAVQRLAPPAGDDLAGLTDAYVAAEYGPVPPQPADVRRARRHWRRVARFLARVARVEP